jgi:adenine/guanine phosphoribosyltransferase-like PRPP-binding protein
LAREVATRLDLDFQTCLQRTGGAKKWHHPQESLRQEPYTVAVAPPAVALIADDFISSGTTMRLSREALAAVGVPSFGFAYAAD